MQTVSLAILEREGRILIARRKVGRLLAGKWEFPGGKVKPDETSEDCLAREQLEEFGSEVEVGEFVASSTYAYESVTIELLAYRVSTCAASSPSSTILRFAA